MLSLSNPGARPQPTERANTGQPKVRARSYGVQRTSAADVIRPVTNVLAVLSGVGKNCLSVPVRVWLNDQTGLRSTAPCDISAFFPRLADSPLHSRNHLVSGSQLCARPTQASSISRPVPTTSLLLKRTRSRDSLVRAHFL